MSELHLEQHEEAVSSLIHGIGILASIAGGSVLLTLTSFIGDPWRIVSAAVYSVSLLLLYTASTLYHAVRHRPIKAKLEIFDHCAIFLLIAGTYTPFTLISLRGAWGWSLFGVVWGLAMAGVIAKLFLTGRFRRVSTLIYIAMGWLVVVALGPMVRALPLTTIAWLVAGGLTYTAGTFFYHTRKIPYAHVIWHLFVLGGSACHFVAVFDQIAFPLT